MSIESQDPRPAGEKHNDPGGALRLDLARAQAVELRVKGLTYREIAEAMEVSVDTAYRYVNKGWQRINEDSDDTRRVLRAVEDERLEQLLAASMPVAVNAELISQNEVGGYIIEEKAGLLMLKAQMTVLRISQRKAALFGFDAPKKIEVTKGKSSIEPISALRARVAVTKERRIRKVADARN